MKRHLTLLVALAAFATPAVAQNFNGPLKARQGIMWVQATNLGILGAMAKGEMEYDAEVAQSAADSLVAVSGVNIAPLFPAGSSDGDIERTRAKAEIWDNLPDVLAKWDDYGTAAAEIQQTVGTGREALGPALQKIGATCTACHDDYQAPRN